MRPFRFAIAATDAPSAAAWRELARRVEGLGYDVLVMPDHIGRQLAPVPALAAAAEATTTLRIGSFVFANDYRNPVLLAKEVATLDLLSGGRFELGIGAGWKTSNYERMGIAYERPGVRIDRMVAGLKRIRACLEDERFHPRPVQPRIPILIGGGAPRILRIAAREADIIGFLPRVDEHGRHRATDLTGNATDEKVGWVRAAAGERFARIELNVLLLDVRVGALATLPGFAAGAVGTPYVLYGTRERIREQLLQNRERFGITYYAVPSKSMEEFAPIAVSLRGS